MGFRRSNRMRRFAVAGAILCAGTVAYAQTMQNGQRIFFSPPDHNTTMATNTESLAPHASESTAFANPIAPSTLNLDFTAPAAPMPQRAPVVISAAEVARRQQAQDRQKN